MIKPQPGVACATTGNDFEKENGKWKPHVSAVQRRVATPLAAARCRPNAVRSASFGRRKSKTWKTIFQAGGARQNASGATKTAYATVSGSNCPDGGDEKVSYRARRGRSRGVRGRNSATAQNPRCRFFPGGKRCGE